MRTLGLLLVLTLPLAAEPRTWTSTDGRMIEASLVSRAGESVVLMLKDGKNATVALDKLSEADREICKVFDLDFKGVNFGEKMSDALDKLPAFKYSSYLFFSCMRGGDATISLADPEGMTVANIPVSHLSLSFAAPGRYGPGDGDATGVVLFSILPENIKNIALKSRFYAASCYFQSDKYERFKAALIVKYGTPATTETVETQNKLGAKFTSEKCTWNLNGATAWINEIEGRVDTSGFTILSAALMPPLKSSDKRDAKDL